MKEKLLLHQISGIEFLKENDRCLLADEAGLGKSRQVLEAAKDFIKGRNMLVICPASTVENWKVECDKWDFPREKFVVVGYEYGLIHHHKELMKRKWGVIVADESQNLRNWEAQRTRNFAKLLKGRDSKVWFMSGTPLVKGAQDLHSILSFIEPGKWGKFGAFCERFCQKKPDEWSPSGFKYFGTKNPKVLSAALSKVMLRRYKADHIKDLPPKLISKVPFDMGYGKFDIFINDQIMRAVVSNVEQGGTLVLDKEVTDTIQELALKKVDNVVRFCEDTLFPHPLVIFTHHRMVNYDIAEKLRSKGRRVQSIVGGMNGKIKAAMIEQFQRGEIDDLVCSLGTVGVGVNLFRSSRCVFAEFPWTWAAMDQASDRLHRIGQHDSVNVYQCYAKGTFEEAQLKTIEKRKDYMQEIIGTHENS